MHKKFFINFIILSFLILAIIAIGCDFAIKNFNFIISTSDDNAQVWINAWFEKKIEIAKNKSSKGRKIMFIGGSSTLFGINTKEIENKFHIPTINFGTNGGYQYINFQKAKEFLKSGDIAIVPLEYDCYKQNFQKLLSSSEIEYIFLFDKKMYKDLTPKKKLCCICFMLNNLIGLRSEKTAQKIKNHIDTNKNYAYGVKSWNENGDNTYKREYDKEKIEKVLEELNKNKTKYYDNDDIAYLQNKDSYLNDFIKFTKENNIKLIFIAPSIVSNSNKANYNIKEVWDSLDITYIDNIDESFMKKEYFYDSLYHLTTQGANIRTEQIINLINKYGIINKF